ncbi:MAG: hypothetical protein OEV92_11335, partial [Nitrospinota bacterium]|nr:hypothetical protein [Nitrospinota bacterium]
PKEDAVAKIYIPYTISQGMPDTHQCSAFHMKKRFTEELYSDSIHLTFAPSTPEGSIAPFNDQPMIRKSKVKTCPIADDSDLQFPVLREIGQESKPGFH